MHPPSTPCLVASPPTPCCLPPPPRTHTPHHHGRAAAIVECYGRVSLTGGNKGATGGARRLDDSQGGAQEGRGRCRRDVQDTHRAAAGAVPTAMSRIRDKHARGGFVPTPNICSPFTLPAPALHCLCLYLPPFACKSQASSAHDKFCSHAATFSLGLASDYQQDKATPAWHKSPQPGPTYFFSKDTNYVHLIVLNAFGDTEGSSRFTRNHFYIRPQQVAGSKDCNDTIFTIFSLLAAPAAPVCKQPQLYRTGYDEHGVLPLPAAVETDVAATVELPPAPEDVSAAEAVEWLADDGCEFEIGDAAAAGEPQGLSGSVVPGTVAAALGLDVDLADMAPIFHPVTHERLLPYRSDDPAARIAADAAAATSSSADLECPSQLTAAQLAKLLDREPAWHSRMEGAALPASAIVLRALEALACLRLQNSSACRSPISSSELLLATRPSEAVKVSAETDAIKATIDSLTTVDEVVRATLAYLLASLPQPFVRSLDWQMDRCSGTNISQFTFGGISTAIAADSLDAVFIHTMVSGHTKFCPDILANKLANKYNASDCFSIAHLAQHASNYGTAIAYDLDLLVDLHAQPHASLFKEVPNITKLREYLLMADDGLVNLGEPAEAPTDPFPGASSASRYYPNSTINREITALKKRSLCRIYVAGGLRRPARDFGVGSGGSLLPGEVGLCTMRKVLCFVKCKEDDEVWLLVNDWSCFQRDPAGVAKINEALACTTRPADKAYYGAKAKQISEMYGKYVPPQFVPNQFDLAARGTSGILRPSVISLMRSPEENAAAEAAVAAAAAARVAAAARAAAGETEVQAPAVEPAVGGKRRALHLPFAHISLLTRLWHLPPTSPTCSPAVTAYSTSALFVFLM